MYIYIITETATNLFFGRMVNKSLFRPGELLVWVIYITIRANYQIIFENYQSVCVNDFTPYVRHRRCTLHGRLLELLILKINEICFCESYLWLVNIGSVNSPSHYLIKCWLIWRYISSWSHNHLIVKNHQFILVKFSFANWWKNVSACSFGAYPVRHGKILERSWDTLSFPEKCKR